MASCLVPDVPAVMVALEHLKELDKQLQGEGVPFSPEASLHLTEITAAITELEAERRAAHEHLEVETIENSKLRHQFNNMREQVSQEITADVAAARASNSEEMEQLHKDLDAVSQLLEAAVKRRETLLSQNEALYPEREQVRAEREEIIAAQNDQITLKYGLQMQVDRTQDQIEELKSCVTAVEQDKIALQQKMVLEREAFTARKDDLSREVDQAEEKIERRKQSIRRTRRELDRLNDKKRETRDNLGEIMLHLAKLESNLRRLAASRCQCEKELRGETQKHQELKRQRETLKKESRDLGEALCVAVQHLKEEIATMEGKIEEGRASRLLRQDSLAEIYEVFRHQRDEENEVRAEHLHVSQRLERSELRLQERIASVAKHSEEIKEMDKQIRELLESDTITKRVLVRNQEELCESMHAEKKNVSHFEEENRRLTRLLEESKRKQEEHEAKMTSDISNTRRRYQELRREEAILQKRQPESTDADMLMIRMTQCEMEYRQKETEHREELVLCTAETAGIRRRYEEKLAEVEVKGEILKELEAKRNEEQLRHQRLKTLSSELRRKKNDLELSIQGLKEKTGHLLRPREEMKAVLEEMRQSYMDMLDEQASELRAVEMSVYDNSVKLEQVGIENSRLHLCIRQMTGDVDRAGEDKGRYRQEAHQFKRDTEALSESLQEAWREDSSVTLDCQNKDGALLAAMSATLSHLRTRRQQLGNVSALLQQQILDFSERLGDETIIEQQS